jgi:hypothetical protein
MSLTPRLRRPRRSTPPDASTELQRKKLALEIAELKRSAWMKPTVVLPVAAAVGTLALSQYLGVFEVERKRIELSYKESVLAKQDVEMQIRHLSSEKNQLEKERTQLTLARNSISSEISSLNEEVARLKASEAQSTLLARSASLRAKEVEQRLSVPKLSIGWNFDHSKSTAELRLVNRGLGPAQIRSVQFFVDDRPVPAASIGSSLARAIDILDLNERWVRTEERKSAILSNEVVRLVQVMPEEYTETRSRQLQSAVNHFGSVICYCSNFGKCEWAVFQRPIPQQKCEAKGG